MTALADLPLLETPYPTQHPWYDLSPLLVNGCRALTPGSCGAAVDGNVWSPTDHPAGWERQE